jgi:hypothetical protein
VADCLIEAGIGTLLIDLVGPEKAVENAERRRRWRCSTRSSRTAGTSDRGRLFEQFADPDTRCGAEGGVSVVA